ncbi:MAG: DNA-3-methyladenine glycosylase 2 family protein [Saprospiraceae bacterium]|nr:DNA-3-methyladenine glycosylase 2 family protein [Saprospiraceae bacterium]
MKRTTFIQIPHPKTFDFNQCLFFMDRGYDECLYTIENSTITKALTVGDKPVLFRISSVRHSKLQIDVLSGYSPKIITVLGLYVSKWLDLDRDLAPFYKKLGRSNACAELTEKYKGLHLINIPNLFESICWSIIGQQINLSFAYKLKRRLVEKYGTSVQHQGKTHLIFPTPKSLQDAVPADLKIMQFSKQKINYLLTVANAFNTGQFSADHLEQLPTMKARQAKLLSLKGIGIWSANYVLMKSLNEPDSIPFGDAGLNKALKRLGIIKDRKEVQKIEAFFRPFAGWQSYLTLYLWRHLYGQGLVSNKKHEGQTSRQ